MKIAISIIFIFLLSSYSLTQDFWEEQKKFEKVKTSINDKETLIANNLKEVGLITDNFNMLIIAYKSENIIDVYVKKKSELSYRKLSSYNICSRSGQLGPKRKYGDNQVPEGFYYIDRFNPTSNFYLSLGINYPNKSDRLKSKSSNLGGDIFIHGNCVTIGCIPITDDKIKEVYLYAVHAKNNKQEKIPVYIFPFKMTNKNMESYVAKYAENKTVLEFWKNLKLGFDKFEKYKTELSFVIDSNGDYKF